MKHYNPLEQVYELVSIERIMTFIAQFPEAYLFCCGDSQIAEIKFDE